MLRGHTESLARNLKIPMENLKWYAAFHNEGHHPHVHIIAYSENEIQNEDGRHETAGKKDGSNFCTSGAEVVGEHDKGDDRC